MENESNSNKKWIGATLAAAFLASLCCITPVLALIAGIGGAASTFSWMEPFRPYLIGLTALVLGFAWYQKLKPKQQEIDCACDDEEEEKKPFLQSKTFLGVVTVLAILLLTFPYYSSVFFPEKPKTEAVAVAQTDVLEARLVIEGMTCSGCENSVNYALTSKDGVIEAASSYEDGTATVKFDQSRVTVDELAHTVEKETGYKVTDKRFISQQ